MSLKPFDWEKAREELRTTGADPELVEAYLDVMREHHRGMEELLEMLDAFADRTLAEMTRRTAPSLNEISVAWALLGLRRIALLLDQFSGWGAP